MRFGRPTIPLTREEAEAIFADSIRNAKQNTKLGPTHTTSFYDRYASALLQMEPEIDDVLERFALAQTAAQKSQMRTHFAAFLERV